MNMFEMKKKIKIEYVILFLIIILGAVTRIAALDKFPMGLHQDEAYSAYNAFSVMNYGVDSYGYTRPVYYTVWGSGMSVLYSYLTMPFFALFGINVWTIRLPQAILGTISILAAYLLGKEIKDKSFGLFFAAILAINPWHIQQSRFGLDANLAVPMLLFGITFLCRYLNGKRKSLWAAAIFFGLTLYCYAITWPLVPAILILVLIFYRKRICFDKQLVGAIAVLFVLALPLLLFLAVNYGWIPEIKTSLFSIPKLPAIRTDEFSLSLGLLKRRVLWMLAMLWAQHDDLWWITNQEVGAYYYVSAPFVLLGLAMHLKTFVDCIRKKQQFPLHFIMAIWFGTMFLVGCGIDIAKYYKVNCIHISIIFYSLYGMWCVWNALKKSKIFAGTMIVIYGACFVYFLYTQLSFGVRYENYGNTYLSHMHWNKYEDAIATAESITDGDISISCLSYSNVMLYKRMSPYEYMETVVYEGDNLAFRNVVAIGRYYFGVQPGEEAGDMVFVFPYYEENMYVEAGYEIIRATECYGVAYKQ